MVPRQKAYNYAFQSSVPASKQYSTPTVSETVDLKCSPYSYVIEFLFSMTEESSFFAGQTSEHRHSHVHVRCS